MSLSRLGNVPNFRGAGNHVIGNSMRLESTTEVQLDEEWKVRLSNEQLACFDHIAGWLNRKYGYHWVREG